MALSGERANEWQDAAMWQAKRGYSGKTGDPLPELLSHEVCEEIENYPEEWQEEVRRAKYAHAMREVAEE